MLEKKRVVCFSSYQDRAEAAAAAVAGSEEEAGWGRLLVDLVTKLALVSLFVVTPAVWLRPHLRRRVPPPAVV